MENIVLVDFGHRLEPGSGRSTSFLAAIPAEGWLRFLNNAPWDVQLTVVVGGFFCLTSLVSCLALHLWCRPGALFLYLNTAPTPFFATALVLAARMQWRDEPRLRELTIMVLGLAGCMFAQFIGMNAAFDQSTPLRLTFTIDEVKICSGSRTHRDYPCAGAQVPPSVDLGFLSRDRKYCKLYYKQFPHIVVGRSRLSFLSFPGFFHYPWTYGRCEILY